MACAEWLQWAAPSIGAGLSPLVASHSRSHGDASSTSIQPQCYSEGQAASADGCGRAGVREHFQQRALHCILLSKVLHCSGSNRRQHWADALG
eukprot:9310910-Pyramimonas_sp.AAC.1